jgi:hypothetical protein
VAEYRGFVAGYIPGAASLVDPTIALPAIEEKFLIRRPERYWTLELGPKFSRQERAAMNLRRFYALPQVEYCRNFIFKRHFPIHPPLPALLKSSVSASPAACQAVLTAYALVPSRYGLTSSATTCAR